MTGVLIHEGSIRVGEKMETQKNKQQVQSKSGAKRIVSARCPKCGHSQPAGPECTSCGIIFAKLVAAQKRKQVQKSQEATNISHEEGSDKKSGFSWFQVMAVVLVTFGITFYFLNDKKDSSLVALDESQEVNESASIQAVTAEPKTNSSSAFSQQTRKQTVVSGTPLEIARKATVSIETPWGTGSGFFINSNYIITNKHVVQLDEDELGEFREKVETSKKLVSLEKKKLRKLKSRLREVTDDSSKKQIRIIISEIQKGLNEYMPQHERNLQRLTEMEKPIYASDIKVILEDGAEYYCEYLNVSDGSDLALLTIEIFDSVSLPRGKNRSLKQGDRVFTVGSPVGLRNTVTSGVFSGYRVNTETGAKYLQTDAPINPGNSGGPLIDETGNVHGINTMILRNTEGIGFAIPIEVAFEEFGSVLM